MWQVTIRFKDRAGISTERKTYKQILFFIRSFLRTEVSSVVENIIITQSTKR